MALKLFPVELLQPCVASLSGEAGNASLTVPLRPFEWEGGRVETEIRLDGIDLPSVKAADLAGRVFHFPLNDERATLDTPYIDGSLYLDSVHHPVDITVLDFAAADGGVTVEMRGVYCFAYEGLADYDDTPFVLTVPIEAAE